MNRDTTEASPKDRLKKPLVAVLAAEVGLVVYVLFSNDTARIVQEFGLFQDAQSVILYISLAVCAYQVWRRSRPLGAWWFLFGVMLMFFCGESALEQEYLFGSLQADGVPIRAFSVAYLAEDIPLWIKFAVAVPSAVFLWIWLHGLWKFRSSLWSAAVRLRGTRPHWLFVASMLVLAISQLGYAVPGAAQGGVGVEEVAELLGETLFLFAVLDLHLRLREFAPRLLTGTEHWIPSAERPASLPTVSCIVPVHNEAARLAPTIESLLAQDYPAERMEIVVALNGCTDASAVVARRYPVKVVESDRKGMSFGKNLGARAASGDLFVFVDADTVLPPQGVGALVAQMRRHARIVATVAGLPERGGLVVRACFWIANRYAQRTKTHAPGGIVAIDHETYAAIKGFDEGLRQGTSTDLLRRACATGAEYVCVDTVRAATSIRRFEKTGIVSQMMDWRRNHKMLSENERAALAKRAYQDVR